MRAGSCGALDARTDVQREHEEIILLPEGMEEGSIPQTSAVEIDSANAGLLNERARCCTARSLEGLPAAFSRSFIREGLCGALDASTVVQQEHEEIILLPAGLEEGSIAQTCAVSFSSAIAGLPNKEGRCPSERSLDGLPTVFFANYSARRLVWES